MSARWRPYATLLLDIAARCGVQRIVSLGAVLAAVPHTRLPLVTGTSTDPTWHAWLETRGMARRSRYEGPAGAGRHVHMQVLAEDACGDPHRRKRVRYAASYRFRGDTSIPKQAGRDHDRSFFWGGTGMPGIFTLTAPR